MRAIVAATCPPHLRIDDMNRYYVIPEPLIAQAMADGSVRELTSEISGHVFESLAKIGNRPLQ